MSTGSPYVRLKIASSLDGRTANGFRRIKMDYWSNRRQDVQHWRAISGARITGFKPF